MQRRFDQLDDVWPAGLGRRLGAMLYDALLVVAVWILIGVLHVVFVRQVLGLGAEEVGAGIAQRLSLQLLLVMGAFLFFAFSWMRGGMTLGMQAWRLRVQTRSGHSITLRQSLVRYLVAWLSLAAFGLGYLWVLFDTERRSWSDIASGTRVVVLPRASRR
ncbi:RDD family protein [Halomonas sp. MCCC 1A17488]|uniref:RDD family protein n=1 Tax=Billgrantia sulfidoxydans TaxID=2733484 RepID=A0ABX7W9Z9_9GAMM|nr:MULTISPECIES: RDD family protein [Halomonas]MCE8017864.1 RDD family protein [Halomonas sp. MCCC 1A17488]MCG3241197.1 RDD family protein [Halomonas sp. MCCC 1A17488]QPP51701.1 RDD family protein [Halomonas sp. SS10-MC5]QTP57189.1 RDD family protein [Halomonas sulfidoxydans]